VERQLAADRRSCLLHLDHAGDLGVRVHVFRWLAVGGILIHRRLLAALTVVYSRFQHVNGVLVKFEARLLHSFEEPCLCLPECLQSLAVLSFDVVVCGKRIKSLTEELNFCANASAHPNCTFHELALISSVL
jgi:hypothetical protein